MRGFTIDVKIVSIASQTTAVLSLDLLVTDYNNCVVHGTSER